MTRCIPRVVVICCTTSFKKAFYEEKIFLKQGKLLSTEYFTWFPKNISEASCRHFFKILFTHAKNVKALILTRREQDNCPRTVAPPDNYPPENCLQDNCPPDNCASDNCPPKIATPEIVPQIISHWTIGTQTIAPQNN